MSEIEKLLKAIVEETDVTDYKCRTRMEHFLKKCACGEVCDDMTPRTRVEELLVEVSKKIANGSGEDSFQKYLDDNGADYLFCYAPNCSQTTNIKELKAKSALEKLDFSNCTSAEGMFRGRIINDGELTDLYFPEVTKGNRMFYYTTLNGSPNIMFDKLENPSEMFYYCDATNGDFSNIDFGKKIQNASHMFNSTKNVNTAKVDFSSLPDSANLSSMFANSDLKNISNVTFGTNTYWLNTSYMCQSCTKLEEFIPNVQLHIEKAQYMFKGCTSLKTIRNIKLKVDRQGYLTDMLLNCSALENLYVKHITHNFKIGSGTSWGHNLTVESLLHCCQECYYYGSNQTLTMGTANLEKLANVYVKLIDELPSGLNSNHNLPFEVCESTDEGAMTVSEYMALKKWLIA